MLAKSAYASKYPYSFTFTCSGCGVQLRAAMWPLLPIIIPALPLWAVGMTAMVGHMSGHWPWSNFLPAIHALGAALVVGAIAALITGFMASPVSCRR